MNRNFKTLLIVAGVFVCGVTFAGPRHHHHRNDGLALANGIVDLVLKVVAPQPVVVAPAPAVITTTPAVVAPAPAVITTTPAVVAPAPVIVQQPIYYTRPAPPPPPRRHHHRPAPHGHRGGHRGGHRR